MSQSSIKSPDRVTSTNGFTLIEVLVAFLIMAVFLGVLYQTFSSGLKGASQAAAYSRATLRAESLLAGVGISNPLTDGESQGEFSDGQRWRVTASAVSRSDQALKSGPVAYEVTVEVFWGEPDREQLVRLNSIKWGKVP